METSSRQPNGLADALKAGRLASGLSVRQLAEQSGVAKTVVSQLENGIYKRGASPASLARLAAALELRTSDVFVLAGIPLPDDLPSLPVMLRAEYDLPAAAIDEMQRDLERIARKYRRQAAKDDPPATH